MDRPDTKQQPLGQSRYNPNITVEELYHMFRRHSHDGVETDSLTVRGTAAPTTRPSRVGQIYCDTTNAKVYISTGTTTSSDWKLLN